MRRVQRPLEREQMPTVDQLRMQTAACGGQSGAREHGGFAPADEAAGHREAPPRRGQIVRDGTIDPVFDPGIEHQLHPAGSRGECRSGRSPTGSRRRSCGTGACAGNARARLRATATRAGGSWWCAAGVTRSIRPMRLTSCSALPWKAPENRRVEQDDGAEQFGPAQRREESEIPAERMTYAEHRRLSRCRRSRRSAPPPAAASRRSPESAGRGRWRADSRRRNRRPDRRTACGSRRPGSRWRGRSAGARVPRSGSRLRNSRCRGRNVAQAPAML